MLRCGELRLCTTGLLDHSSIVNLLEFHKGIDFSDFYQSRFFHQERHLMFLALFHLQTFFVLQRMFEGFVFSFRFLRSRFVCWMDYHHPFAIYLQSVQFYHLLLTSSHQQFLRCVIMGHLQRFSCLRSFLIFLDHCTFWFLFTFVIKT